MGTVYCVKYAMQKGEKEMISAAGIKVYSYLKISRVTNFHMEVKKGRHGKVVLRGTLSDVCATKTLNGDPVKITIKDDITAKEEILFQGVLQSVHIFCENGVNQAILSALTNDIKLDEHEKSHSYQDASATYIQLMKKILNKYQGRILCNALSGETGYSMIQYKETDWQFCKRLSSGMGLAVFCNPASPVPQINVGLVEKDEEIIFQPDQYKVSVDEDYYHMKRKGDEKRDFLYYQIDTEKNYEIGCSTYFRNQKYYIFEKTVELINAGLVFRYKLGGKCRFTERKFYNEKISGLSLSGRVEKTDKQSVYMKLDIDGKTAKALYPYPWTPATGNLMYCMPQAGTWAYLYFADWDERNARAINSIRTNASYQGFSNVQNRLLETEHGKQMQLYPERIGFIGGTADAEQKCLMETDEILFHNGTGKLRITGKEKIILKAPEISLSAVQKIGQYKMSGYARQKKSEIYPKGSRNPATGGGGDSANEMQNEYNTFTAQGILYGTEYENYKPFDDAPDCHQNTAPPSGSDSLFEKLFDYIFGSKPEPGGAAPAASGIFSLQLGIAVGAIAVGSGIAAAVATATNDTKQGKGSSLGKYLADSFSSSVKAGGSLSLSALEPYTAETTAYSMTLPYSAVDVLKTTGNITSIKNTVTDIIGIPNMLFQPGDMEMFIPEPRK